jgi:hypothetical protein
VETFRLRCGCQHEDLPAQRLHRPHEQGSVEHGVVQPDLADGGLASTDVLGVTRMRHGRQQVVVTQARHVQVPHVLRIGALVGVPHDRVVDAERRVAVGP